MGHIKVSATRAEVTPREWLQAGAQLGDLVNTWAGRTDIVAYVGPGAGGQTPACFNPQLAEVEVNVSVAFGAGVSPELIGDIRLRDTQFDYPRASGAIFHEALHARYSRFDLSKAIEELTPSEYQSLTLLEETRIEKLGVENFPANRVFLRACAMDIVLSEINEHLDESNTTRAIGSIAGLVLARIDAGSLEEDDVIEVKKLVLEFLGEETYGKLRNVWLRFQMHDDHRNPTNLYVLAKEWDKILSEVAKERGEQEPVKGTPSIIEAIIEEILDEMKEASENIAISVNDDAQDQEQQEDWKEIITNRDKAAKDQRENKKTADDVFSMDTAAIAASKTLSSLLDVRKPEPKERAAAVKIAQMLEKAKYRERDEKEIKSILPPGNLRTRAMVQNAAYKAQGSMLRAEPWRRTVRKHTDDPTLNVGVIVDISGSMNKAMQPMAVTAWAMSEAVRRVQGRCAMVYYGNDVFPTLKPGQHLDQVNVYSAPDGTEKFNKAFKAVDGALNLINGTGARLLVVVSDGCYVESEVAAAKEWIKKCDASGVAVLWLPFTESFRLNYARDIIRGTSAVLMGDITDPVDAALEIGRAAATALSKIGSRLAA